jgi:endonuclease/exonuclease/phosphatase family metal-dependent hydrolase
MIRSRRALILAASCGGLLVAVAIAAWIGSIRGPAGPAMGFGIAGVGVKPVDPGPTMVFASYNIRTGRGRDDQRDLKRTAECLKAITVIGLNEVRGSAWHGRPTDQAETLGGMLGLGHLFAPTERRFGREHFGNALLTAVPVTEWLRVPLPRVQGDSHRSMLLAELALATGRLTVLVTHVDARQDREVQLAAVAALFRTLKAPAILLGDLNAGPEHPDIARMLTEPGVVGSNGAMPPAELPGRVEWIVAKGLKPVAASRCDNGASDHPRVALEVATPR